MRGKLLEGIFIRGTREQREEGKEKRNSKKGWPDSVDRERGERDE